jgi:beta-galactosidase
MKNNKVKTGRSTKNRRSFLKSLGVLITGMSVIKPSFLFGNKSNAEEKSRFDLSGKSGAVLQDSVQLPEGVKAVWDVNKAFREITPTREHICINGLWQWQPAELLSADLPAKGWGYFKVPGTWPNTPGASNENQILYSHPLWDAEKLKDVTAAWYQREINIPDNWAGRSIILTMEYINSNALVFIDGQKAGELWFPAGELELTSFCKPGVKHVLTVKLKAVPLKDVITAYSDTNMGRQVQATVVRRGICGDVFVCGLPKGPSIDHVAIETSCRKGEIAFKTGILNLAANKKYKTRILIKEQNDKVAEFTGKTFGAGDLAEGLIIHTEKWMPEKLWDTHTPQNIYSAEVSLLDASGKLLDAFIPERFGYRELWVEGRDFYPEREPDMACQHSP